MFSIITQVDGNETEFCLGRFLDEREGDLLVFVEIEGKELG